jgi:hypothetical protein
MLRQVTIALERKYYLRLQMRFTESEIEKAKELRRLKLQNQLAEKNFVLGPGHYISARECPTGCIEIHPQVFLIVGEWDTNANVIWLPTIDDLLEITTHMKISFSLITDYLHRRRFADGKEREGIYQLLIEKLR